jgi:hypothetical protein
LCVCAFSLHRESPDMILRDKPLISDVILSQHDNEKKCLECGQSRSIEVVTQDGEKVTMEVAQKQLHYFPITSRLKRLFISKRTVRHMRWHKEGIRENDGVMGHPLDGEA